jgi:hypothetical protein
MTDKPEPNTEAPVRAPAHGVRDESLTPDDAYAVMAEFGVSYATSAKTLHMAGIEAQATGRLSSARAKAWADLRKVDKRILLDFTFAEVPSPETCPARSAIPLAFPELSPPTAQALAAGLRAPAVAMPPSPGIDLPLPSVDAWALADELVAGDRPAVLPAPSPQPFVRDTKENQP